MKVRLLKDAWGCWIPRITRISSGCILPRSISIHWRWWALRIEY
jgi:hypothetical protein